ncbi:hypothetical protein PVAND_009450 [Polypedilum vanderplanki]|uniref:MADF domain-containing protein n=1 Tax=Polypedilum vanderplanki TaxID=319348 RepID=A0A9J6CCY3_POLVA|nr:hypothetical protein PVAND_009450 [Polypedilum vanderplanki]
MFNEFTVKLITEVRKREILYNTKYDKRPKAEKERCWEEIAESLNCDAEKCKKHWKNIRDRFVKVMHARDRHFMNNGSEIDAPAYIYYDMMSFMREFSIKKDIHYRNTIHYDELTPEPLVFNDCNKLVDVTKDFLIAVRNYPVLYDKNAEMRKYRGKEEWKKISDALYSRFTIGKLRNYWTVLMKKYKLYEENRHGLFETIRNEHIFNLMSFVHLNSIKHEQDPIEYITEEDYQIMENDNKDNYEESLIDEEEDENFITSINSGRNFEGTEIVIDQDNEQHDENLLEEHIEQPSPKKRKINIPELSATPSSSSITSRSQQVLDDAPDEYDYFGKKVAIQLKRMSLLNPRIARKAEIEVLQLLLKYEEELEKN